MSRIEHDSMGEIEIQKDALWGAQTQRSLQNFNIGEEKMPIEIIYAFGYLKMAAACANHDLNQEKMTDEKASAIIDICDKIVSGQLNKEFPLKVWQTGSGTQTNMNVNEVIANCANKLAKKNLLHANDDVNMSQSSNDTFPSAMNIAAVYVVENKLIPAIKKLVKAFNKLEKENEGIIKSGRTHLQDATPIAFSQEISGWRASIEKDLGFILDSLEPLREIALGGTAVGTGLNCPKGFDNMVAEKLTEILDTSFVSAKNKFHALSSKDEFVYSHGALKALATDLMKIANDIRWLASGPRCGLGEITIPANEPGSSIMPGKVNPTQCEAVCMVAVQVMANDVAVSLSASQGNFELNVYMPVLIYNYLQSVKLLADVINSFNEKCVSGIKANKEKMKENMDKSLMIATVLSPVIGYEKTAKVVEKAYKENISLKDACCSLGYLSSDEYDKIVIPQNMV